MSKLEKSKRQKTVTALAAVCLCVVLNLITHPAIANGASFPDHIGDMSQQDLFDNHPNFTENFAKFGPTQKELDLIQALNDKEVIVIFGTWCHDSVREVPRFLKLLEAGKVSPASLTLYGIDRRKSDPEGFAVMHQLKYTPTIIVRSGEDEIARMIERPKLSLAEDLALQINSRSSLN